MPQTPDEIRLTDGGFEMLRRGSLHARVRWAELRGVAGFKRFLGDTERICLGFCRADLSYVEVREDDLGYDALLAAVCRQYPDHDAHWLERVRHPAGVRRPAGGTCWTVIWGATPQPVKCAQCGYDLRGCVERRCPECGTPAPPE